MNPVSTACDVYRIRLTRGVTMEFRRIPAGCFLMGSRGYHPHEEPRHRVRITHDFYMGLYPVTQEQFAVWTATHREEHTNRFENCPKHPAENLDWFQALAFCLWLNEAERRDLLPPGYVAALPTEAEWEYACRAGTDTEYYSGDGAAVLDTAAWYDANSGEETHPVGERAPNAFGLHDTHGNVWEWCWDAYDGDAYKKRADGVTDPGAADRRHVSCVAKVPKALQEDNRSRVGRGGSWGGDAGGCRSAFRDYGRPGFRGDDLGFRVCLVPGPVRPADQDTSGERLETERGGTPSRSRKARGARNRR